ncbi:hypothetical protein [Acetobacter pasteurianus]|nr:hypothetical protein [Acetobacter pasteurianus]GBR48698.1 hypothetical protein AA11825_1082 [Acetobacter pomorum DSM 11825]
MTVIRLLRVVIERDIALIISDKTPYIIPYQASNFMKVLPPKSQRSLVKLGSDISVARRKRGFRLQDMSDATGFSIGALRRLEAGHPGSSIGMLCEVMRTLGEDNRLYNLIDISDDATGLDLDVRKLPKRVRPCKGKFKDGF